MGRLRLADALTDFGAIRLPATHVAPDLAEPPPPPAERMPEPSFFDPAPMIADAVRRAEDALSARLGEAHAVEVAGLRLAHAEELSHAMQRLGADTGAAMAAALTSAEERILKLTTDAVARLLAPMLEENVARRSVEHLARAIGQAQSEREALRIRVRGPRPLLDGMAQALGERAAGIQFEEQPGFDLSVAIDDTLYETRLGEWSEGLAEALR
jgi:hypothetical protein